MLPIISPTKDLVRLIEHLMRLIEHLVRLIEHLMGLIEYLMGLIEHLMGLIEYLVRLIEWFVFVCKHFGNDMTCIVSVTLVCVASFPCFVSSPQCFVLSRITQAK